MGTDDSSIWRSLGTGRIRHLHEGLSTLELSENSVNIKWHCGKLHPPSKSVTEWMWIESCHPLPGLRCVVPQSRYKRPIDARQGLKSARLLVLTNLSQPLVDTEREETPVE